jgi:nitroimidazol reductase NimA-like FMN-containing flavoprotein (pyridoxamine 5'-phosphate oxidase superfamily)
MKTTPASPRVRVRRIPDKGRYDQDTIYRIIDESLFAHLAFVDGDQPMCIPMLCARVDNKVMVHGSTASRTMRTLAAGAPACLTVTSMRGLVVARSTFESSANYESVTVLGRFHPIDRDEVSAALEAFSEKLIPGRWQEARLPIPKELKATQVVAMPIEEASAKISSGPPEDDDTPDAQLDIWAGVVPMETSFGEPEPSPGLRPGIAIPPSVEELGKPKPA